MHVRHWWLYLVFLISPVAYAEQTINGVKLSAIGQGQATILPNGTVISSVGFRAQVGTNPPKFYDRAVNFTKGQTGASIKKFAKGNAFQLGLTVGILGIGWVLDEITGDIYTTSGTQSPYSAPSGYYWSINGYNGATPRAAAQAYVNAVYPGHTINFYQCYSPYYCEYLRYSGGSYKGSVAPNLYGPNGLVTPYQPPPSPYPTTTPTTEPTNSPPTPATDTQVADQVVPQLEPKVLPKLHTDPLTGAVEENQAVLDKMTEIANEVAKLNDPDNTPVTPPGATVSPTTSTPAIGSDTPPFCIYASIICDWIGWTKEPPPDSPDPEMPLTDLPAPLAWSSGQSSGQCPNDKNLNLQFVASQSFNYQPICQLAVGIKPLVIASAGLFALFILSGFSRRKES